MPHPQPPSVWEHQHRTVLGCHRRWLLWKMTLQRRQAVSMIPRLQFATSCFYSCHSKPHTFVLRYAPCLHNEIMATIMVVRRFHNESGRPLPIGAVTSTQWCQTWTLLGNGITQLSVNTCTDTHTIIHGKNLSSSQNIHTLPGNEATLSLIISSHSYVYFTYFLLH